MDRQENIDFISSYYANCSDRDELNLTTGTFFSIQETKLICGLLRPASENVRGSLLGSGGFDEECMVRPSSTELENKK